MGATYPGERLGLPAEGTGSIAGWNRRIVALGLDWITSTLVAAALLGTAVWGQGAAQWAPMGVFLLQSAILTALLGGSFGQRLCGVTVARLDGRPVNLLQALLRSLLVCLVIPPLVFNRDQRGLHDLAVSTVTVRR